MVVSIYPVIEGEHREVRVETDISAPSGPFDSPPVIKGRLLDPPGAAELGEIAAGDVLYEGEVYTFRHFDADGWFELRKSGETSYVSFVVER